MRGVWPSRLGWSLAGSLGVWGVLQVQGYQPDPVRLALLLTVAFAAVWLVTDLLRTDLPGWDVHPTRELWPRGQDPELSRLLRTIESHLTADRPDENLRRRLREAAGRRLHERHGLDLDDPRARELLGGPLVEVLTGPVRAIGHDELHRLVERMERL